MRSFIFRTIFPISILVFGIAMFLFNLVYFTREWTKIVNFKKSGTIVSDANLSKDSVLTFVLVDTLDFPAKIYPAVGDTINSVNDSAVLERKDERTVINRWDSNFYSPLPPGRTVPLEFKHNGAVLSTYVLTRLPGTKLFLNVIAMQMVRFSLSTLFILLGIWALVRKRESGGIRALTLFNLSMAAFFIVSVRVLSTRYATFEIPLVQVIQGVLGYLVPFFGAFWLNLQLLFPRPKRFLKQKPMIVYCLCYLPVILLIILAEIGVKWSHTLIVFAVLPAQIFLGFFILCRSHRKAKDNVEKRQTKLVLWGSGSGLAPLIILIIIISLFSESFGAWRWKWLLINLSFYAMLLTPLSFVYAFQRYRLLEVEGRLKRGTRFTLAMVIILALFVGFVYVIGELLLRQLGISSRTPTLIASLALAIGLSPALQKLRNVVEHRFFPERHKLRELSRDFVRQSISITDGRTLWEKAEGQLKDNLKIDRMFAIISPKPDSNLILMGKEKTATPFRFGTGLMVRLARENRPILVDEALVMDEVVFNLEEEIWLMQNRIALILPLFVKNELLGFLGLGFKVSGEDYTAEELQILSDLSVQISLTSENLRLLEENISKKRMEEELAMARRIQQGFLPGKIPFTPGLEIAARNQFCLEVAGDYYDVITLQGSRTIITVGDVSGKGAAAALLMANLQACLRTAMGISAELAEIVGRINDLIFQNTPDEQYITFFAGTFKPDNLTLTYVNAGHNPPILLRKGETIDYLETGGLILGYLPGLKYQQGEVQLEAGDLMVLYTDGVSETMNSKEQEFGQKRIEKYIQDHFSSALDETLDGLEAEVREFRGEAPLIDDYTIMLVRVIG